MRGRRGRGILTSKGRSVECTASNALTSREALIRPARHTPLMGKKPTSGESVSRWPTLPVDDGRSADAPWKIGQRRMLGTNILRMVMRRLRNCLFTAILLMRRAPGGLPWVISCMCVCMCVCVCTRAAAVAALHDHPIKRPPNNTPRLVNTCINVRAFPNRHAMQASVHGQLLLHGLHLLRTPSRLVSRVGQFRMPIPYARIFSATNSMHLPYNTYTYKKRELANPTHEPLLAVCTYSLQLLIPQNNSIHE
eukprot:1159868-Pelagomonas_calceolata.AAC.2